jgi:hypothetical protein
MADYLKIDTRACCLESRVGLRADKFSLVLSGSMGGVSRTDVRLTQVQEEGSEGANASYWWWY